VSCEKIKGGKKEVEDPLCAGGEEKERKINVFISSTVNKRDQGVSGKRVEKKEKKGEKER